MNYVAWVVGLYVHRRERQVQVQAPELRLRPFGIVLQEAMQVLELLRDPARDIVEQVLWWPNPMTTDWPQLFTKAQGKGDFGSLVQQTENVRKMVRTEIWQVLDQTEPPAMQTK